MSLQSPTEGGAAWRRPETHKNSAASRLNRPATDGSTADDHRVPPHDLEAEKAVLSALLLDNDAIHSVYTEVIPEDFYHPAHRQLYRSMLNPSGLEPTGRPPHPRRLPEQPEDPRCHRRSGLPRRNRGLRGNRCQCRPPRADRSRQERQAQPDFGRRRRSPKPATTRRIPQTTCSTRRNPRSSKSDSKRRAPLSAVCTTK